ncbi:MAG TPA: hypothetical protein VFJ27_05625 [Terriglobia bacterium]|nr:hypothetical protein [Terriglobia bacterium]
MTTSNAPVETPANAEEFADAMDRLAEEAGSYLSRFSYGSTRTPVIGMGVQEEKT